MLLKKARIISGKAPQRAELSITNDLSLSSFTVGVLTQIQLTLSVVDPATFAIEYAPAGVSITAGGLLSVTAATSGPHRVGVRITLDTNYSIVQELYFVVQPQEPALPPTPTGLSLVWVEAQNRFSLTWVAQGAEVVGYELDYSINSGPPGPLLGYVTAQPILLPNNAPPLNVLFVNDDVLTVNFRAVNSQGLKSGSASASATVVISQVQLPPELSVAPGDQTVDVTWTNPVNTPTNAIVQVVWRRESLAPTTQEVAASTLGYETW